MGWWTTFIKAVAKVIAEIGKAILKDAIEGLRKVVTDWWNGKKLAVIGPTAVGKNCFYHRLKGEPISEKHQQTRGVERIPAFAVKHTLPDGRVFKIHVKRSVNIGGETDQRERFWMDACEGADVIFYMLSLEDLRKGMYAEGHRIYDDLKWLACRVGRLKPSARIHFLVNKIDFALLDGKAYDRFLQELKPKVEEFEKTAKLLFKPYAAVLTGVTPTSMKNDHVFAVSFPLALNSVYDAVHS